MVQGANKGMLIGKVNRLMNQPRVTKQDVQKLREDIAMWGLKLEKDLELNRTQLRGLFRVEAAAALEDPENTAEDKREAVSSGREGYGLEVEEARREVADMLKSRCKGCLVNAVGDLMQGDTIATVREMQKLERLAAFADTEGFDLDQPWEVSESMRKDALRHYASSAVKADGEMGKRPNLSLLGTVLGVDSPTDA